jgi:hypothetical protein
VTTLRSLVANIELVFLSLTLWSIKPPRSTPGRRKFGTNLSTNTEQSPLGSGSVKKVVRVRRTPKSSNLKRGTPQPSPGRQTIGEHTLSFSPGPVGLQLEPIAEDPKYGCRVVRFVDGGPNNPGQARKSGAIKPGDLVLHVEAEGIVETTYEGIVGTLRKSDLSRVIAFRSVWDTTFLETQTNLKFQPFAKPPLIKSPLSKSTPTRSYPMTNPSPLFSTPESSLPVPSQKPQSQAESQIAPDKSTPPASLVTAIKKDTPVGTVEPPMDTDMVKSPSGLILLSAMLPKPENVTKAYSGPMIVPIKESQDPSLQAESLRAMSLASVDSTSQCSIKQTTQQNYSISLSAGDVYDAYVLHRPVQDYPIAATKDPQPQFSGTSENAPNCNSATQGAKHHSLSTSDVQMLSESPRESTETIKQYEEPAFSSPTKTTAHNDVMSLTPFSPSNVKKLSKSKKETDPSGPRVFSRVLGSVYNNVAPALVNSYAIGSTVATTIVPAMASSSYVIGSAVTSKIGETIVGNSSREFRKANELKLELLNELSQAKAALDIQDTDKAGLKQSMEALFRENVSLRAEFEQRLQGARIQQVSTIPEHFEDSFIRVVQSSHITVCRTLLLGL